MVGRHGGGRAPGGLSAPPQLPVGGSAAGTGAAEPWGPCRGRPRSMRMRPGLRQPQTARKRHGRRGGGGGGGGGGPGGGGGGGGGAWKGLGGERGRKGAVRRGRGLRRAGLHNAALRRQGSARTQQPVGAAHPPQRRTAGGRRTGATPICPAMSGRRSGFQSSGRASCRRRCRRRRRRRRPPPTHPPRLRALRARILRIRGSYSMPSTFNSPA